MGMFRRFNGRPYLPLHYMARKVYTTMKEMVYENGSIQTYMLCEHNVRARGVGMGSGISFYDKLFSSQMYLRRRFGIIEIIKYMKGLYLYYICHIANGLLYTYEYPYPALKSYFGAHGNA